METCEMQRIEPLLGTRGSVDPLGDVTAHLLLDVNDRLCIQLLGVLLPISFHVSVLEMLGESLLVVRDKELSDAACVVVRGPMEQIVAILVEQLNDSERVEKIYALQDRLELVDIEGGEGFE